MLIDYARILVGDEFYELDPMNFPVLTKISDIEYEFTVKYNISGVSGYEIEYYSTVEAVSKTEYNEYLKEYYDDSYEEINRYEKKYKYRDVVIQRT